MVRPSHKFFYGSALRILGAAIGMAGGFAVLVSGTFGMFVKPIGESLSWSRSEVSLLSTMAFLGYAIGSPLIGGLYDRFGVGRVQIAAVLLFSLGLASLSLLPNDLPSFLAVMLGIGLTSAATAPSGYVLILAKTIQRRLGLAIALAMLGLGVGVALGPALAQNLIATVGWRQAYAVLALVALVAGSIALLLGVGRPLAIENAGPILSTERRGEPDGLTLREALKSWRFWLLGLTSLLVGVAGFGALAHLVAALSDMGVAGADAARMAGLLGIGILVGRITAALLMDRFFAPAIACFCYGIGGAGLFLLARLSPDQTMALSLAALLAGLLTGSEGDTMPFLTRHYFGLRAFGSIFGCVVGMAGVGALIGPLAYGASFDLTGGYGWVFQVSALLCVASGVSLLLLGPYRYCISQTPDSVGQAK